MNTTPFRIFYFTEFQLVLIINYLIFHQHFCNTTLSIMERATRAHQLRGHRMEDIETLPSEEKDKVYYFIDKAVAYNKTKKAFAH
jgi:hypothetical protein